MKKLVAPSAPTAADREEHTASGHAVFSRECCVGRGRMHQHRAGGRETAIPAIAIDNGHLNERDDQLRVVLCVAVWCGVVWCVCVLRCVLRCVVL